MASLKEDDRKRVHLQLDMLYIKDQTYFEVDIHLTAVEKASPPNLDILMDCLTRSCDLLCLEDV